MYYQEESPATFLSGGDKDELEMKGNYHGICAMIGVKNVYLIGYLSMKF